MASRVFDIVFRTKGTDQAKRNIGDVDNKISDLGATAKQSAIALGTALAASTAIAGTKAIRTAADFEMLRTRLRGLTGDQKEANRLFDEFNKIAANTPFSVQEVIDAGATLQAFQLDAEELLVPIADLAAFMQIDISMAAQNFGRAMAAGAGSADLFREKGINQLVASFAGVENVTDLTLPEFREALQAAIVDPSVGIAGATSLMADTLIGKFSNAGDSVDRLAAEFGDKFLPIIKDATDGFIDFVDTVDPDTVLEYAASIGIVTTALGAYTIAQNAANLSSKAFKVALPIIALTTVTVGIQKVIGGLRDIQKEAENSAKPVIDLDEDLLQFSSRINKLNQKEIFDLIEQLGGFGQSMTIAGDATGTTAHKLDALGKRLQFLFDEQGKTIEQFGNFKTEVEALPDVEILEPEQINTAKTSFELFNEAFNNYADLNLKNLETEKEQIALREQFIKLYPEEAELLGMVTEKEKKRQQAVQATADSFGNIGSIATSTSQLLATLAGEDKDRQIVALQIAKIAAIANIAQGVTKAFAQGGVLGFATGASVTAAGAAQIATIDAQIAQLKKAQYGIDQMVSSPTLILAGEAGPERVQVTPSDRPASQQQGALTINFNGPVTSREFVRDTIIPEIDRVQKLGLA